MPGGNNRPGAAHAALKSRVLFLLESALLRLVFSALAHWQFAGGYYSSYAMAHFDYLNHFLMSNMYAMKLIFHKNA
jgi:hypothetical protein